MKKIIEIINPELCNGCRFCHLTTLLVGNQPETIIECSRKDCDNWNTVSAVNVDIVEE